MIYLNRNLPRKLWIPSVLIGKLLIEKRQQKILDQVERIIHPIPIMAVQLLIVVDIGKHRFPLKYDNLDHLY
jgi:hypothetical protein